MKFIDQWHLKLKKILQKIQAAAAAVGVLYLHSGTDAVIYHLAFCVWICKPLRFCIALVLVLSVVYVVLSPMLKLTNVFTQIRFFNC